MRLFLAGPKAGKTVKLNGLSFVSGMADVDAGNKPLISYFGRYYGAYPEGSPELAKALKETGGEEIYYGKRGVPQNPTGSYGSAESERAGAQTTTPENQSADDGADTYRQGSNPTGDRHPHAGTPIEKAVIKACMELDPVNPSLWTNAGRAKFAAVLEKLGDNELKITREQINEFGLDRKQVADRLSM